MERPARPPHVPEPPRRRTCGLGGVLALMAALLAAFSLAASSSDAARARAGALNGPPANGLPDDTLLVGGAPVAAFENARALAADPSGTLYVADAGRDVIVRLAPGAAPVRLGGPGAARGAFDHPADLDATNGLVLYVADAGNGRIQRFSNDFQFLGALAVGEEQAAQGGAARSARPVAVHAAPSGALYVVDDAALAVRYWQPEQRRWRHVGGFGTGAGALREPVALAYSSARQRLYVADRGRAALLVYDAFGSYLTALLPGRLEHVRAVVIAQDRLWLVEAGRVLVCGLDGRVEHVLHVQYASRPEGAEEHVAAEHVRPGAIVDLQPTAEALFLLTPTALYRAPLPGGVAGR